MIFSSSWCCLVIVKSKNTKYNPYSLCYNLKKIGFVMDSEKEYKLSTILYGHSLDVRVLDVNKDDCILSGSRDKTAKFWRPNGFNSGYTETATYKGHKNYVSAVCFLNSTDDHPNGLIVTGGNDSQISVYHPDYLEPIITAKAHSNTVCCLSRSNDVSSFLTASWDCTSKMFTVKDSTLKELVTYSGHQAVVWAAIQLPNNNVVTGSADKELIIWSPDGRKLKTLKGHTDCVRGLAVLNDCIFLSVANDASVRQWTFEGDCIETLYGHNNYIYSISVNKANGENCFVTSGEDRSIRYWEGSKNVQTITLPAQSVWAVACLSNGDIVTGSSDGLVRVFTQDPGRVADDSTLKQFEEEVANLNVASSQEIGGVKISDLPGKEVLYEPGKSDGQTKLVREGTAVICYSWSQSEGTWNKVGDVMGAAGGTQATSGKTLYEGKEYDFVFTVDVEDGKPPLKLPFNLDQDPWVAAQEFIHKNNLPQAYLEQVANFIVQNSGNQPVTTSQTTSDFVDPFTGASRYTPGSNNVNRTPSGVNLDPFTGGSSYSTSSSQNHPTQQTFTTVPDPFTGGQAYTTSTQTQSKSNYFPQLQHLKFSQGNTKVILEKMMEFNQKSGDNSNAIDESLLEGIVKLSDDNCSDGLYIDALIQLLNWEPDVVFPILDVTRLAVRHAENNLLLCSHTNGDFLLGLLRKYINHESAANKMLSLRVLCNMFSHLPGETLIINNKNELLEDTTQLENLNKNSQIALSTFLLNLGISLVRIKDNVGIMQLCSSLLKTVFKLTDPEAEFRAFVAFGTVLSQVDNGARKGIVNNLETFKKLKEKLSSYDIENFNDPNYEKNSHCAKQLANLLQ